MRRDLVSWLADYGEILNFTVLKPVVDENEPEGNKYQFDLALQEDSGGNAENELRKILQKVTSIGKHIRVRQNNFTLNRSYHGMTCLYIR